MTFATRALTPRIGTEIIASKETLLAGGHSQEIRDLLEQRGVLLFHKLGMTDEEQVEFAKTLGQVIPQGEKGIYKITLDTRLNDTAHYLKGTPYWHIDGVQDDVPTRASLLTARVLSKVGGQTEFANTYAAYDDLPEDEKRAYEKLRVVHTQKMIQSKVNLHPSKEELEAWDRTFAPKTHPLVWTHQSGRKSLVVGIHAASVEGMDEAEGRILIDRLQAWSTQPQFVYRHEWTVGDMIIWDNTGVMHRVEPYPADSGRLLSRTTLVGEEALA
ncbi:TauD/TfdA family dioxygenase [Phenylobacterium sp. LjRoot225]|uniref:TauD/TfdA dioxygenase family protein n=1 Tax=Phenylobacterium sp. LjRoot225 TaxID=3342285 RepID=UPI003ED07715